MRSLGTLASEVFDVAIVGGGITGCCIARDAARRGLRVALVEQRDFSSGTSAATSKMVHGGLRYLETFALGVVRESLRERRAWQTIAPHLVRPLTFLLPTHGRAEDWKYRTALAAYDALSFARGRPPHPSQQLGASQHLSADALTDLEPVLTAVNLRSGMRYDDCHAYAPERIALECLMDACDHGAQVANHVEAERLVDGVPQQLEVRDCLTSETFTVQARLVVNASGPWSELLGRRLGAPAPHQLLRSKGIHIVTRPLTGRAALTVPVLGRHFFVIPWRDHSLIGTTDTPYDGSPDDVGVTEADLDSFLVVINAGLPAAHLSRDDVQWAYAGLRPLIAPSSGGSYRASRRAEIVTERPGLLSVIGGKWTTSRGLAQRCVDVVVRALGAGVTACDTATAVLPGGRDMAPVPVADAHRLERRAVEETVHLHGARAGRVLDLAASDTRLGTVIAHHTLAAAVVFAVRHEMALTLGDVLFRRTGAGTLGPLPHATLGAVTQLMAAELGWSTERATREVDAVLVHYRRVSMLVA